GFFWHPREEHHSGALEPEVDTQGRAHGVCDLPFRSRLQTFFQCFNGRSGRIIRGQAEPAGDHNKIGLTNEFKNGRAEPVRGIRDHPHLGKCCPFCREPGGKGLDKSVCAPAGDDLAPGDDECRIHGFHPIFLVSCRTRAAMIPAAMSSAMMPTPPSTRLSMVPTGGGLTMSKNLKSAVPMMMSFSRVGREMRVTSSPQTSSITTRDGSLPH